VSSIRCQLIRLDRPGIRQAAAAVSHCKVDLFAVLETDFATCDPSRECREEAFCFVDGLKDGDLDWFANEPWLRGHGSFAVEIRIQIVCS
jgi:hypothetical protein